MDGRHHRSELHTHGHSAVSIDSLREGGREGGREVTLLNKYNPDTLGTEEMTYPHAIMGG